MNDKRHSGTPASRQRQVKILKKELRRHVHGKPTPSRAMLSLPRQLLRLAGRIAALAGVLILAAGFSLGGLGFGMLAGYVATADPIDPELIKTQNETTRILDADGREIAILTGSQNINRQNVSLGAVQATYIDEAFKAIEDERFDEHAGIDPRRIGSAILSIIFNGGSATHGGSTITQQTVRLLSGDDQRSAQRKIQEWYKAVKLETQKSKDEIMELYLNLVPMGNSFVGIQSAAQAYFDKESSQLDLLECAFLAGIPNRPSTYNPWTESGKRNALRRMRIVLGKMADLGWITAKEFKEALNSELVFRKRPIAVSATQINSYYVDYVIGQAISDLAAKRGYSEEAASIAVYGSGLTIKTAMDQSVQNKLEAVFAEADLFEADPAALEDSAERPNGSIVVISNSPDPGQIKGMVGGRGEKTGNFVLNRAVSARRQPGSSIKPLAVYGPAIDTGKITAATIFTDQAVYLDPDNPDQEYPKNSYTTGYKGNMAVRRALTISCNTIAAQIWQNILGGDTSLQYLQRAGLGRPGENYVAIALGGFNQGMTALEMAGAYAVFANQGLYAEPCAYTEILSADGRILLENRPEFETVFKPETACILTDLMSDVLDAPGGTAAGYGIKGMPCAGKTGTTDGNLDKWFCGFTPYYTAAVWYGYDNRLGRSKILKADYANAIKIWHEAMTSIHEGLETMEFFKPAGLLTLSVCKDSGMLASENCRHTANELFIDGAAMNPCRKCGLCAPEPSPTPAPSLS